MNKLPYDLRMAMTSEINSTLLDKFPIFRNHFSKKTMKKILEHIEEKTYLHEETLFLQN